MEASICDSLFGKVVIQTRDNCLTDIQFLTPEYIRPTEKEVEQIILDRVLKMINVVDTTGLKDIAINVVGTQFQKDVWNALSEIPFGKLLTYSELANKIGKPSAHRAVANACGRNRLAILVPCHRVVRTDGSLGGYSSGGVGHKIDLLRFEGVNATPNGVKFLK